MEADWKTGDDDWEGDPLNLRPLSLPREESRKKVPGPLSCSVLGPWACVVVICLCMLCRAYSYSSCSTHTRTPQPGPLLTGFEPLRGRRDYEDRAQCFVQTARRAGGEDASQPSRFSWMAVGAPALSMQFTRALAGSWAG